MKTGAKLGLALVGGAAVLILTLLTAGLEGVISQFARIEPVLVAFSIAIGVLSNVVRALKWKLLLRPIGYQTKIMDLFWLVNIGNLVNLVTPIRAGDVVRPVLLTARGGLAFGRGLGSVAAERVMDLVVLAVLGVLALFGTGIVGSFPPFFLLAFAVVLGTILAGVVVLLFGLRYRERVLSTVERILRMLPFISSGIRGRVVGLVRDLIDSLRAIMVSPFAFSAAWVLTFAVWLLNALSIHLLIQAFSVPMQFLGSIVGTSLLFLSFALPAAPGYVGSIQAVWLLVFGALGLSFEESVAISIFYNTINIMQVAVLGAAGLSWLGFSLGKVLSSLRSRSGGSSAEG
jgi:uncharacterized protein (TIRG00374 family)